MTPDLFAAGAERAALASGRPLSQELAEIRSGVGGDRSVHPGGLFADAEHLARFEAALAALKA